MTSKQVWGEVQGSMGKNSSISREVGAVQDVGHVDQGYVLLLSACRRKAPSMRIQTPVIGPAQYRIHTDWCRDSEQADFTLGRNAEHAPHSPLLSVAHFSFSSKMTPCCTIPRMMCSTMQSENVCLLNETCWNLIMERKWKWADYTSIGVKSHVNI